MVKKLCCSRNNKVISGVCGGIAEYFSTDPTIVRLVWGATFFLGGTGFIAYIVAAVIMPKSDYDSGSQSNHSTHVNEFSCPGQSESDKDFTVKTGRNEFDDGYYTRNKPDKNIFGIILILLGAFFLLKEYIRIDDKLVVPLMLIVVGMVFIFRSRRRF
ncbi:MAG TPA: PspC domain-containing protein [Pseudobacteroides sp.]|uniref:PspC domain-containing protein n=1 Tax=Pseudobacteroides sp. TaxID=1968840 RepID=UPI002F937FBB